MADDLAEEAYDERLVSDDPSIRKFSENDSMTQDYLRYIATGSRVGDVRRTKWDVTMEEALYNGLEAYIPDYSSGDRYMCDNSPHISRMYNRLDYMVAYCKKMSKWLYKTRRGEWLVILPKCPK